MAHAVTSQLCSVHRGFPVKPGTRLHLPAARTLLPHARPYFSVVVLQTYFDSELACATVLAPRRTIHTGDESAHRNTLVKWQPGKRPVGGWSPAAARHREQQSRLRATQGENTPGALGRRGSACGGCRERTRPPPCCSLNGSPTPLPTVSLFLRASLKEPTAGGKALRRAATRNQCPQRLESP